MRSNNYFDHSYTLYPSSYFKLFSSSILSEFTVIISSVPAMPLIKFSTRYILFQSSSNLSIISVPVLLGVGESKLAKMAWLGSLAPRFVNDYVTAELT